MHETLVSNQLDQTWVKKVPLIFASSFRTDNDEKKGVEQLITDLMLFLN